ncbi:ATP synthase F1 subunit epsilon [bacterium]|nr:MAG: ATP synthase F1 subunit epsilon [bacterium]
MAKEFALSVVAPDREVVAEGVTSVIAPGVSGYFGVLADHLPLVAALKPGLLEYIDASGQRHFVYVGGGFVEVKANRMTVLADEASAAKDIDLSRAEADLDVARRALRGEETSMSQDQAVHEVEKAMQRIRAARAAR